MIKSTYIRATIDTALKQFPMPNKELERDDKLYVKVGNTYPVTLLDGNGLYQRVELVDGRKYWIFLPHWVHFTAPPTIHCRFTRRFNWDKETLHWGELTFLDGNDEMFTVAATSGRVGYQYPGAHIQKEGYLAQGHYRIITKRYDVINGKETLFFYHIIPKINLSCDASWRQHSEFGLCCDLTLPNSCNIVVKDKAVFDSVIVPFIDNKSKQSLPDISLYVYYS